VHYLQVSREAAEVATKVKGSWGSGIAEEHIAWVPIVSGLREYAEASLLAVLTAFVYVQQACIQQHFGLPGV
jgi:hypothetical protein